MNSNTNSNTATGQTQLSNRTSLTGSQRFSSTIYVQGMEYVETLISINTIHTNVNGKKYRKGKSPYNKTGLNQDCKHSCILKDIEQKSKKHLYFPYNKKKRCCDI